MIDNLALFLFHSGLLVLILRILRWPDPDADVARNRTQRGMQAPSAVPPPSATAANATARGAR